MEIKKTIFIIFGSIWLILMYYFAISPYFRIIKLYGRKSGNKLKSIIMHHFFFSFYASTKFHSLSENLTKIEIDHIINLLKKRKTNLIIFLIISFIAFVLFHLIIIRF